MSRDDSRLPDKATRRSTSRGKDVDIPPPPPPSRSRRIPVRETSGEADIPVSRPEGRRAPAGRGETPPYDPPPGKGPSPPPYRRAIGTGLERRVDTSRTWHTRRTQQPSEANAEHVDVAMVCAKHDRPFVVRFAEKQGLFAKAYHFKETVTAIAEGGGTQAAISLPLDRMNWTGIKCPHCGAVCRPIRCGRCEKLVCDGLTTEAAGLLHFRCAASCGASGIVGGALTSVSGSAGRGGGGQKLLGPPNIAGQAFVKSSKG